MFTAIAAAVFVVVFCLFVSKSLLDQSAYNSKIIGKKDEALKTLQSSRQEAETLRESYVSFATEPINVLGGSPTGTGPKDGDNAKLVLDSLPYELDFPALSSSIEKILTEGNYTIQAIGGDDKSSIGSEAVDLPAPGSEADSGAVAPVPVNTEPVEVEFPFAVSTSIEGTMNLLRTLELSIRPFNITSLNLEGKGNNLDVRINMKTYYKPKVGLQVITETVAR